MKICSIVPGATCLMMMAHAAWMWMSVPLGRLAVVLIRYAKTEREGIFVVVHPDSCSLVIDAARIWMSASSRATQCVRQTLAASTQSGRTIANVAMVSESIWRTKRPATTLMSAKSRREFVTSDVSTTLARIAVPAMPATSCRVTTAHATILTNARSTNHTIFAWAGVKTQWDLMHAPAHRDIVWD